MALSQQHIMIPEQTAELPHTNKIDLTIPNNDLLGLNFSMLRGDGEAMSGP